MVPQVNRREIIQGRFNFSQDSGQLIKGKSRLPNSLQETILEFEPVSQYPPHQGAFSTMNLHSIYLLGDCTSSAQAMPSISLEQCLKVLTLSDIITNGKLTKKHLKASRNEVADSN